MFESQMEKNWSKNDPKIKSAKILKIVYVNQVGVLISFGKTLHSSSSSAIFRGTLLTKFSENSITKNRGFFAKSPIFW